MRFWDLYIDNLKKGNISLYKAKIYSERKWTKEELEELERGWREGVSAKTLALKFARTENAIKSIIKRFKVYRNNRKRGKPKSKVNYSKQEMINLYLKGHTIKEIAKMSNCCFQYVSKVLKQNNIDTRTIIKFRRKHII